MSNKRYLDTSKVLGLIRLIRKLFDEHRMDFLMIMPTFNNNLLCAVQGSHFGIRNPSQSRKGPGMPFPSRFNVFASSILFDH